MINVEEICKRIDGLISKVRIPLPSIPSVLIACSVINRPGLSAMLMASEIIRRQPEAGAYFGPMPDGSKNVSEAMERIRCEVIVNAIKSDAKVEASIPPGGIITAYGPNLNCVKVEGIIR